MLGLLLMAGLGFAATAIMEHVDNQSADDDPSQDHDDHDDVSHGSMLDDPSGHSDRHSGDAANAPGGQADPANTHDGQANPAQHMTALGDHTGPNAADAHQPSGHQPSAHQPSGHQPSALHHAPDHPASHHQPSHHQPSHHQPPAHQTSSHQPQAHHPSHHQPPAQQASDHHSGGSGAGDPATHHAAPSHAAAPASHGHAADTLATPTPPVLHKVFGTEANDTLQGSARNDLMGGNGGDDRLHGHAGNDHLVASDAGRDTVFGDAGNDTLHGYYVQPEPGHLSFMVEDHQADHLHGGIGNDRLYLASDDVGTGGQGADQFHLSWDITHGHPAQITDYNPALDKIYVEFSSNHADLGMTHITPDEMSVTTQPMKDGSGTEILINGQSIAHVLGASNLRPSDIGLIHA